jgi:nitroimidazol reductase NimA-like FMN-containing flavoprotein (pyridoxamine 5'-phosphate oxidase superfamily)
MKLLQALKELPSLSKEEIDEFLKQPHIMRLAVMDSKGEPNVTPVWYLWEDDKFYITSQTDKKKYKDIQRNSRVGFSIDIYEPENKGKKGGGKGVHGKGNAYVIHDKTEISRRDRQLIVRYTGDLENPAARRLLAIPNVCLIVIEPTELGTWDSLKA